MIVSIGFETTNVIVGESENAVVCVQIESGTLVDPDQTAVFTVTTNDITANRK